MRMDFKSSRLLGTDQSKKHIVDELARDVSAFANTEGGILVIGIETGREAEKAMAVSLSDGVDPNVRKPEWLQQVVAANISPPLNGLVVRPIPLSGPRAGKVAYVIEIPKGETAHQAPDLRYYGRHELESKPLADNEIRLRMNRGRAAHATIELMTFVRLSAEAEFDQRQDELARVNEAERLEREGSDDEVGLTFIPLARQRAFDEQKTRLRAIKHSFDECTIELAIRNDGPITIRDCSLSISTQCDKNTTFTPPAENGKWLFHFLPSEVLRESYTMSGTTRKMVPIRERKLFPEHATPFPGAKFTMSFPAGRPPRECTLDWVLYLDDAPSIRGVIDLAAIARNP